MKAQKIVFVKLQCLGLCSCKEDCSLILFSGFFNGMILFDEEDSGSHNGRLRNGTLPDIFGPNDVALMFCCRHVYDDLYYDVSIIPVDA